MYVFINEKVEILRKIFYIDLLSYARSFKLDGDSSFWMEGEVMYSVSRMSSIFILFYSSRHHLERKIHIKAINKLKFRTLTCFRRNIKRTKYIF